MPPAPGLARSADFAPPLPEGVCQTSPRQQQIPEGLRVFRCQVAIGVEVGQGADRGLWERLSLEMEQQSDEIGDVHAAVEIHISGSQVQAGARCAQEDVARVIGSRSGLPAQARINPPSPSHARAGSVAAFTQDGTPPSPADPSPTSAHCCPSHCLTQTSREA